MLLLACTTVLRTRRLLVLYRMVQHKQSPSTWIQVDGCSACSTTSIDMYPVLQHLCLDGVCSIATYTIQTCCCRYVCCAYLAIGTADIPPTAFIGSWYRPSQWSILSSYCMYITCCCTVPVQPACDVATIAIQTYTRVRVYVYCW